MGKRPKARSETTRSKLAQAAADRGFTSSSIKKSFSNFRKSNVRPKARKK